MEMSTLVQVLWSVLQLCFKPIQSYQEPLHAVDTLPFLLNFWFLKRLFFFLSIKWKCLLGTFLLIIFFSFSLVWREKCWRKKKKDWRNEEKVGRVMDVKSRGGRTVQGNSARFGVWVPAQPSVKVHFFTLKHEWNVQWRPVDNGAFILPPTSVSRFSCVLLEIFCHFYSGAVGR